ncbi:MAG: neuraminidase [Planctomycetes bacterium]|nr:neuraminidase [Planctomycetota bacterium]
MGNGACTGADGARDIVFRRVRIKDNHGEGQAGRDKGGSNGLVFSGYGAPDNRGKNLSVEQCTVFNLCNPNNLCWPRESFRILDVVYKDFKPRSPIVLSWDWHVSDTRLVPVARGWARNSVNAVIFRRNSIVTHKGTQYVAFYDEHANVVLAKRQLTGDTWEIRKTQYRGNANDAHNSISIMVDGDGFLHMSWDHHGHALRYCRSQSPGSLTLTEKLPMTGHKEDRVTYPEFYRLPNGNLLFLYRDGSSGRGNLMMNHYNLKTRTWTRRQDAFIHGQDERNAYWQMCTDTQGTIHISWVWRETGDIATNHDIAYAKSTDGGHTWQTSNGQTYSLPITAHNAEYAARIPQNSELINTTSMCADTRGRPYIATYWRPKGTDVPQYHLVYHDGAQWHTQQISRRTSPFRLSGGGTKRISMSRPQIFADCSGDRDRAYMLFRDAERGDRVSLAACADLQTRQWQVQELTDFAVGLWEPGYDTELWKRSKVLHVYVQNVDQGDGDRNDATAPPTDISILEWTPQ